MTSKTSTLILILILLTSCSTPDIRSHTYQNYHGFGSEGEGYGAYSYVVGEPSEQLTYLKAVISNDTASASDLPPEHRPARYNIFQIPINDEVGKAVLAQVNAAYVGEDATYFNNPGPYIFTLREPLGVGGKDIQEIYFVDLTHTNRSLYPDLVAAYKKQLVIDDAAPGEFKSLLFNTLSLVLGVTKNLGVVKIAIEKLNDAMPNV